VRPNQHLAAATLSTSSGRFIRRREPRPKEMSWCSWARRLQAPHPPRECEGEDDCQNSEGKADRGDGILAQTYPGDRDDNGGHHECEDPSNTQFTHGVTGVTLHPIVSPIPLVPDLRFPCEHTL
jgi:hypothetical protein